MPVLLSRRGQYLSKASLISQLQVPGSLQEKNLQGAERQNSSAEGCVAIVGNAAENANNASGTKVNSDAAGTPFLSSVMSTSSVLEGGGNIEETTSLRHCCSFSALVGRVKVAI